MSNKLFLFIFLGALISCNNSGTKNITAKASSGKADSIKILSQQIDSFHSQINELNQDLHYWFSETEIDNIKSKGIADPEKYITDNLLNTPKLIPYKAVLGGTMRFWKVTLLGDRWAVADFEDGHIGGNMLLKYTIQKDSSIKWKVIDIYTE